MKVRVRERDGVVILDMKRRIEGGPDADAFHDLIKACVADGKTKILVNLAKVNFINSTGLGILLSGYTSVMNAGGRFKLVNISERIKSILMITKLLMIFEVYTDEDEAIASFALAEPLEQKSN